MKLILYKNTSDKRKVGKNLTEVATLDSIYWKEDTDILHPVFTFHKFKDEDGNAIWKNFNYCALEWSGMPTRYYFVENFKVTKGGVIEIHCSVDVLETYKSYIRGLNCIVRRQERVNNKLLQDDRAIVPFTKELHSVAIGTVGDGGNGTIILTVSG